MASDIFNGFSLEPEVKSFLAEAAGLNAVNYFPIKANIYSVKKLEELTDKIIKSNEELSRSNNRHAKVMLWLTGALVFVGIMQVIAAFVKSAA